MKIRNGFVSNSSSSSFIVAFNENEKCPHCGRSDPDILDLIYRAEQHGDGETCVNWDDPDTHIETLTNSIKVLESELAEYNAMPNGSMAGYNNSYHVEDLRVWTQDELDNEKEILRAILKAKQEGKKIASFDISYHDETLNDILGQLITTGSVEIIMNGD